MTIYTDNRGYRYLGDPILGNTWGATFGGASASKHDSSTGGSTVSEFGTCAEAVWGTGKWGINAGNSGAFGEQFANQSAADLVFTPSSITKSAVDVTSWSATATGNKDAVIGQYVFGLTMKGISLTDSDTITINSDNGVVKNAASSVFAGQLGQRELYWASFGPDHLGILGKDSPNSNHVFVYFGLMKGGNFPSPLNRAYISTHSSSTFSKAHRPFTINSTSRQDLSPNSEYSPALATAPNTTGEPYLTRYYPLDTSGTFGGFSGGYLEDLFLYHGTDISNGDIINTADLNPGTGAFDFNTMDGSDFTHVVCVADWFTSTRLVMRIGQA